MNSKTKRILTVLFTVLAAGVVLLSGVMKLAQLPQATETLQKMGVAEYVFLLGSMEIGFTVLYLYRKTMKVGFVLLSCYFAGALATELSHHSALVALVPLILVWLSALLRDRFIFLPTASPA